MVKAKTFDKRRLNWRELWEGPFRYRARFEEGIYRKGHTLSEIESYGREFLEGVARISLSPSEGAIVIEWVATSEIVKYSAGPSIDWVNQLRATALAEAQAELSVTMKNRLNTLTVASSIRAWLEREFRQAVDAGHCTIFARVGNQAGSFTEIPADVFRTYRISKWGYGVVGGGLAQGENLPPLFSIHISPLVGTKLTSVDVSPTPRKAGRKPNSAWPEAIEAVIRQAIDEGIVRPLLRGQKAKLERWLCEKVGEISGSEFADNAARRYVKQVIDRLPHKSSD